MKITKTQLRKIIKEEMEDFDFDMGSAGGIPTQQAQNVSAAMKEMQDKWLPAARRMAHTDTGPEGSAVQDQIDQAIALLGEIRGSLTGLGLDIRNVPPKPPR